MADVKMGYAMVVYCVAMVVWISVGGVVVEAATNTDCSEALAGVAGCATFLTNPSSTPDQKGCCQPLEKVLSTPASFQCLCAQATNADSSPAFKNALLLPSACKLAINVSEANCTSTPPTSPSTATATPTTAKNNTGSSGFISVSAYSPLVAIAALWSFASLLLL